jgi:hypothetical protein
MSSEHPRQYDFTGELVDNRTSRQKQEARRASGWQQSAMFSQRELAQFGVRARPMMPAIGQHGKPLRMVLEMEDPRTDEEKELAQQRAAEEKTYSLFGHDGKKKPSRIEGRETVAELKDQLLALREKRRQLVGLLEKVLELEATTIDELKTRDGTTRPLRLPEEMGETHHIFGPGFHLQRSGQIFPMPSDDEL